MGSLDRESAVYAIDEQSSRLDDALELASYMETPSTGSAIVGGWSAVEGLLIRAGEGSNYLAADRLAALIACSFPRAEMTALAYAHQNESNDQLASELADTDTNLERVQMIEKHLTKNSRLTLARHSDVAAQARVVELLEEPNATLVRIRRYITGSLRRLYNQRNSVVHAGSMRSVALDATLRTSFSLVGAGLDRIAHAQLTESLEPHSLVARAEIELKLVGNDGGRQLGELLN